MLKKLFAALLLIFLVSQSLYSENEFEISLLTCSSGKETFSAWGHTAIRVIDKTAKIDVVYDFGRFDFNTPNFYGKFVKGRLNYQLGAQSASRFYKSYKRENRQIIEQELNISEQDKIKIISRLQYLYQPENRYYLYRFAGRNCTTELRDLIFKNVSTDFENTLTEKTIRKRLNEFLEGRLWLKFSMSLIMGYKIDKEIDSYESMFLPDDLSKALDTINVGKESIVEKKTIFNQVLDPYKTNYPTLANPIFTFLLLLVFVVLFKYRYVQNPVLFITGLIGLLILLVSLITEHPELQFNLNLLWLNPLYILMAFRFRNRPKLKIRLVYIIQTLIIIMVPIWIFKVQYFELSYLILIITFTLFNLRILYPEKKLSLIK